MVFLPTLLAGLATLVPLSFEVNLGQTAGEVRFLARGRGSTLFLTANGVVMKLGAGHGAVRMRLVGANPAAAVEGLEPLPGRVHYLLGNDPRKWRVNVPTYGRVRYRSVYPGVDLVLYGSQGRLEYDFEVASGADARRIQLAWEGAGRLRLDVEGDLLLEVPGGILRQHRLVVYQLVGGARRPVEARYVLRGPARAGFELSSYDRTQPLYIDPVVSFSTYLGGASEDLSFGLAADAAGFVYISGETQSAEFPVTAGAWRSSYGENSDAFVTKLNREGTAPVYSTYLGGSGTDGASGMAVDAAGSAVVTGWTDSRDFPTKGPYQTQYGGGTRDAFVTKLTPAGDGLVYSTYLGGGQMDAGCAVALDTAGSAYVTGETYSANFPRTAPTGAWGPGGDGDVLVTKLAPSGATLSYSTVFGGSHYDLGCGIKVDASGNAHVTGDTASADFPATPGAVQTKFGGGTTDAWAAKVNPTGTALVYATYLGGEDDDSGFGVDLDVAGNAYAAGWTASKTFPVIAGAYQTKLRGSSDAFLAKLNPQGSELLYSTLVGGGGADWAYALAVDASGSAYLTGGAESADFPLTPDAVQTTLKGKADAFVVKLNPGGSALVYSTYFGGSDNDNGLGIALDAYGNVYVVGGAASDNFPTTAGAYHTRYGGGEADTFILKLSAEDLLPPNISAAGVVSGASGLAGAVAPGEIVVLYGMRLGPPWLVTHRLTQAGLFDTTLAETRVFFDDIPAPLVYTSVGQVSAIVPYAVAGRGSVQLQTEYRGAKSNAVTLPVTASAPAIFTLNLSGKGQGAVLNQDYSVNGPSNPAAGDSVVMVFATGEGQTEPGGVDGKLAGTEPPRPLLPVTAQVGGVDADVLYAGGAPGLVAGVLQVNVRVPLGVTPGDAVPITVKVGSTQSQPGVTIAVR